MVSNFNTIWYLLSPQINTLGSMYRSFQGLYAIPYFSTALRELSALSRFRGWVVRDDVCAFFGQAR